MKKIIICHIGSPDGPIPKSLRHYGIERILQRTIIELSFSIGSYGMGGPGFWGFKLNKTEKYPEEWLIISLWNAGHWLLYDDFMAEVIEEVVPKQFQINVTRLNEITERITGSQLVDAYITDESSRFEFKKDGDSHCIAIPKSRSWNPEESQWDAWVISETNKIWV